MTFTKWMIQEHGQDWQGMNDDLICEGWSEEERSEEESKLYNEFEDYCEEEEIELVIV